MRTKFIRFYYSEAVKPFLTIKKSIEKESPPFDNPPFDESGEPAFLDEWMDAETAKDMVGLHCVSLLSETLKIYFETLRSRVLKVEFVAEKPFKKGFVNAYKNTLAEHFEIDWARKGVDFELIEQVVLARNSASHSQQLNDMKPDHDKKTLEKFPRPFFASEIELRMFEETSSFGLFADEPSVHVSRDRLMHAIEEIEKMADVIHSRVYGHAQDG
jgi:hypothetical protein